MESIIAFVKRVEAKQETQNFGAALQGFLGAAQAKVDERFVGYPPREPNW